MDWAESFVQISFLRIRFHIQKKKLRIICVENEQLHSEITVLSVLNLLYIQLLSEYIYIQQLSVLLYSKYTL